MENLRGGLERDFEKPRSTRLDAKSIALRRGNRKWGLIEIPPPGMIDTIAGNGIAGNSGDGGQATAAELNSPFGIAVDSAGNVYLADTDNNVVREVNAATGVYEQDAANRRPRATWRVAHASTALPKPRKQ
jgi:hypothetical protein